jgi:diphthine-ammonia ligase
MQKNTLCSWSGGKDSCFALMQAVQTGYVPKVLLNVLNEEGLISRSHGIPRAVLELQAIHAGIPLYTVSSSWKDYESNFTRALIELKDRYDLFYAVFGDIDLQAHREWEEKVCTKAGLTALLPLWKKDRKELVYQMLEAGITAIIVSCNETMGEKFIGRQITIDLITELELLGVDPCGENGEYHTLVTDCPLFDRPVKVLITQKLLHEKYWFAELEPVNSARAVSAVPPGNYK